MHVCKRLVLKNFISLHGKTSNAPLRTLRGAARAAHLRAHAAEPRSAASHRYVSRTPWRCRLLDAAPAPPWRERRTCLCCSHAAPPRHRLFSFVLPGARHAGFPENTTSSTSGGAARSEEGRSDGRTHVRWSSQTHSVVSRAGARAPGVRGVLSGEEFPTIRPSRRGSPFQSDKLPPAKRKQ